ncbi:DNA internalization-related competence protein ComEC/Rec2 [Thiobacillus sp.]|uniref:DNA internalization-related competence protein ComEC/Rec2 n=1 Tax=Thiobacillus sp. TaxID=924 RepID=UPI00286DE27A|nr:DNA internalization-related competence protein ComEC/Rec2 [Thiobacillus sp.]
MRFYLIAFCLGVWLLQQQATLPPARWLWLLPLLGSVLWLPRFSRPAPETLRRLAVALLSLSLGFAWAGWRADLRLADHLPGHWQGVDIRLVGVVSDLPQSDARGERFVLDVEQVLTPDAPNLQRIQLARYWPRDDPSHTPTVQAGERWQFTVRLKTPYGTHNPHGFDLEAWTLERGIAASGYVREQQPQRLTERAGTPAARIAATRATIRQRIMHTLDDAPYAGVISALVIGDQRGIPHEQWRAFTRTGVNHLLSISGLHVTMIAALAGWLLAQGWRRLPRLAERVPARQAGLVAAVLAAAAYSLLAGFQVPAQRTLFMLAALVLAFWGQREPRPFSALIWALFIVLLIDPWAVLSAGFWLSFGAMAVILWVSFGRVAMPDKLRGWITVQAAVTLALAPALLLLFQQVSLISPLANAIAIPVVSWLVTPLALLGVIAPPLWHAAAWLMDGLGQGLLWASALPWAVAARPAPDGWATLLAVIGTVWILLPRGFPLRALGVVLWLPLAFPPQTSLTPGRFEADVIDVGQGTAILIRTARHTLLYDTGPAFADSDAGERIIVPYLRATGVGELSGMIVSHDDSDHSGGLRSVLRDLPTGWLLHGLPASSPLLNGAPAPRHCQRGQHWQWDGVKFEILNPPATAYAESGRRDNDYSCVLKVSVGGKSLLITGDGERRAELELLEQTAAESGVDIAATVLVAGHHGSRTSSMAEFIGQVQPQIGIFTLGYRNRFGHPHPQVVSRFREQDARILRSDSSGLIKLKFSQTGVETLEYRPTHRRYWQGSTP